jgi:hypothetical protein
MISNDSLHEIISILRTEADTVTASAHLAAEYHGLPAAQAKLARAGRLRGLAKEIQEHLSAPPATPGADAIIEG